MTDEVTEETAGHAADDADSPTTTDRSRTRRHLVVLVVAVVGLAIGGGLVISGQGSSDVRSADRTTTTTSPGGALLPSLGSVPDLAAAKALLKGLDPRTLRPDLTATTTPGPRPTASAGTAGPPTTAVRPGHEATQAGLRRCERPIEQQTTDRSLGDQLAAARLLVGVTSDLVVSYALPASGTAPATSRVLLVSGRSCRVLAAVQR